MRRECADQLSPSIRPPSRNGPVQNRYAGRGVLTLDGSPLGLDDLLDVARRGAAVEVGEAARRRMAPARDLVQRLDADGGPVYGVNTGFGALAEKVIPAEQRAELQRAILRSHSAGMGPPLAAEVVRGMLLLRARSLTAGHSGASDALPAAICALLNAGITPWVPEHGSVGASGDLAPLAHAASVLVGEGWVDDGRGGRRAAAEALEAAGIEPIALGPRRGWR